MPAPLTPPLPIPIPKLPTLQSLRALAALLVVFDHATLASANHGLSEKLPLLGLFLGSQGVAIFFLISGFIMTYTADSPDHAGLPLARARSFAFRRIVRVVPIYWLLTGLTVVVAALAHLNGIMEVTPSHVARSLFFIPYVNSHGNLLPVLPMGWTLNYEMIFYALFAATVLLPHRLRTATLLGVLGAAVGVGALLYPILSGNNPRSTGEFLTNPVILLFGVGAGLGWLRLRRPHLTLPLPGLLFVIPLLAINSALAFAAHQNPLRLRTTALFWAVDCLIVWLCVFGRAIPLPRLEALGNASYSLYLVHLLPLFACFLIWKQVHFALPILFIVATLGTSAATALASYRWIERPLTRSISGFVERPAPVPEPALQQA